MSRLVDYFVIVGFDHEKERGGFSNGVILQRFPETNWEDVPFHDGIEWFCQPQGWALSTERSEPKFYVSVLTDVDANKHYCACLCFNETVAITPTKPVDEEEEESRPVSNITHHSIMYAPKCLVIVSRQDYIDTFRNCLGIIYTVWAENLGVPLETLVGNLLGGVLVPDPGGPQVRFSIGAGDRQAIQPPAAPPLPVTHTSVHMLFRLLGIHNAVTLWCAVMSEHKVLLVSLAAARLSAACRALAALMFPFRYAHVFIPLLPSGLVEVLATPTPFLIGVHSSLKEEVSELLDVIVADLDVGSLQIPTSVSIPQPEGKLLSSLQRSLALVLQPELGAADSAFPPPPPPPTAQSPPHMQDKEIRAVFMRTLAKLLQGYRHCLTIIRIHPTPVLTFHKAGFLGSRALASCPFAQRLLDSMFYNGFVAERGPPWRTADIWDDLLQNLPEQLRLEAANPELELQHIQDLAMQIHLNENPNPQAYSQRVCRPPAGAARRLHQPPLPPLDAATVARLSVPRHDVHALAALRPPQPRIIPLGPAPSGNDADHDLIFTNSARRLEVLRSCVQAIFECRYLEARLSLPAALRALGAPGAAGARRALAAELANRLPGNKVLLQHHQFDLVTRLMNCALQSTTALDEHSVAAAMLPLATAYCRKLCTGVIQYAYMCIQEHQVWTNQQFWEAAFYQDVQRDIKALYLTTPNKVPSDNGEDSEYVSLLQAQEPSALEIAAEQMRLWPNLDPEKQRELEASEESTLYSQAIHYANRMVYLLLPLEGAGRRAEARGDDADRASNSITNSVAESDSADAESGFEEADPGEAGNNVIKMVSRFVDKVCTEGGVSAAHVRCLHQMIPGVVHMHTETVDCVARECRRLPLAAKPRIIPPALIPGESLALPGLRALLVADGRTVASSLPATGALFLTDYRIVFRGVPADPTACDQTVVRSFPLCSLTKEKLVRNQYVAHVEQSLQEGMQLRSAAFQLIKVAFDEEVSSEQVESFRKQLSRLRYPSHPLLHFAFAGRVQPPHASDHLAKHTTLKGFAKKTLLMTARKAGLKSKPSKRQKYVLPAADARSLTSPPLMASLSADTLSLDELETASVEVEPACMSDARTLERLKDRLYARDWQRLGLASAPYKLTHANAVYTVCRSYPALLAVPAGAAEAALSRVARAYRQQRLPALCYRHRRSGAALARSSAPHHRGVMGMLKSSHQPDRSQPGAEPPASLEQERYLAALMACAPATRGSLTDSSLSLDCPLLYCDDQTNSAVKTPTALGVLGRNSGGKGGLSMTASRPFARWGSLKGRQSSHLELRSQKYDSESVSGDPCQVRRASLYIFTEKGTSTTSGIGEHVEVEVGDSRTSKHAFKKLMRACVPSAPQTDPNQGFYKLIEESGWFQLLRQLFTVSGAVVDLLDLQGSSVLLSLEDGWDVTAQISSLAQLCLDPYYRTIEGFRVLVEKEWLAFGHKFPQRLNIAPAPQQLTPTFLLWLDAVHQLQKQFPLAFEFNDYYLRFLAYHSVSCRYRTFLLDSEAARAELGLADCRRHESGRMGVETGVGSEDESPGGTGGGGTGTGGGGAGGGASGAGGGVWDALDRLARHSPALHNHYYSPELDACVLRPVCSLPALELWEYYVSEQLCGGAPYDLELHDPPTRPDVPLYETGGRISGDAFSGLLDKLRSLELELGHLPHAWRTRWDTLELPDTHRIQRSSSVSSAAVKAAARAAHSRATLDLVVRGRLAAAPRHRFQSGALPTPANCDHCDALMWPPAKGYVRCAECGAACHERCAGALPPCRAAAAAPPPPRHGGAGSMSGPACYEQFSSNVADHRTHEGHLYKRGALLKGWKQRWFVLDSIKHQLRYYDAMEDSHCKGFIDLAEVIAVSGAPPAPPPPKKCDDRSFFDLRTSRRTYNFCASDAAAAQEWIEKLQACLQ